MDKNDILDKAKTIINGERQGTYGNAALGGEIAAGKELFPREKGKKAYDDAVDALRQHGCMLCRNVLKEDNTNEE